MDHHRFQGVDGIDGDLPSILEATLLNNTIGKLFFCTFQILFYGWFGRRQRPAPPFALFLPSSSSFPTSDSSQVCRHLAHIQNALNPSRMDLFVVHHELCYANKRHVAHAQVLGSDCHFLLGGECASWRKSSPDGWSLYCGALCRQGGAGDLFLLRVDEHVRLGRANSALCDILG